MLPSLVGFQSSVVPKVLGVSPQRIHITVGGGEDLGMRLS